MKKEVKITKEEHDVHLKQIQKVVVGTVALAVLFIFGIPDMIMNGILFITIFTMLTNLLLVGWVFRLRYNLLGPLTRYEKGSDEFMELDEVP